MCVSYIRLIAFQNEHVFDSYFIQLRYRELSTLGTRSYVYRVSVEAITTRIQGLLFL
jgi:hypothetical protein